jgi:pantoate--beta-alanine ligase
MVADLNVDTRVVGVPTERELDGLAMSSRNRYLDEVQREQASALSAALLAGKYAASDGAQAAVSAVLAVLDEVAEIAVDYVAARGPGLEPAPSAGPGRLLVAARVGPTRLLDNIAVELGGGNPRLAGHPEMPWRN